MASVAMNDRLGDATEQLMDHGCFVLLWDGVEGLLNHMASKGVHAKGKRVAANSSSNGDDLLRCTVLKAALDEEVTEAVDHERIGLGDNSLHDLVFLVRGADLEFLFQC